VEGLAGRILRLQGDGDYEAATRFVKETGVLDRSLEDDLRRLAAAEIPVDIVFEQE
jgi:hypothetical protein